MNAQQQRSMRSGTLPGPFARVVITRPEVDELPHGAQAVAAIVIGEDMPSPESGLPLGAHLATVNAMIKQVGQQEAGDIRVFVGCVIPAAGNAGVDSVLEWAC